MAKKKFKETGVGKFLGKVAKEIPSVAVDIAGIALGGTPIGGVLSKVKSLLADRIGISTEAKALLNELELRRMEFENEAFELEVQDKASARDLYVKDSSMQKTYALTFLIGYFVLVILILALVMHFSDLPDFAMVTISTVLGGLSVKVGTIVDFLFGSSMGSKQKTAMIKG